MSRSFALAPMSPLIRGLTISLWLLPPLLGIVALMTHSWPLGIFFLLLLALYGAIWVWCRPSRFLVSHNYLEIVFPGWRRRIRLLDISNARFISKEAFQQEFGWAVRIGVGGLWGGFGWLWTSRRGLLEFYISQLDEFVLIERQTGQSLLITPKHSDSFLETVQVTVAVFKNLR